MQNPILQLLNAKQPKSPDRSKNGILNYLLNGGNPGELYNNMLRTNPQFKQFVEKNKDRTVQDIAMEYDIDLGILERFL